MKRERFAHEISKLSFFSTSTSHPSSPQCEPTFEAYKACKAAEYDAKRRARIDARKAAGGGKIFG